MDFLPLKYNVVFRRENTKVFAPRKYNQSITGQISPPFRGDFEKTRGGDICSFLLQFYRVCHASLEMTYVYRSLLKIKTGGAGRIINADESMSYRWDQATKSYTI